MVDVTTIQTALGLAASAASATGDLVGLADRIKGMLASSNAKDPALENLVNDLAGQLIATNLQNVQLSMTVRTLASEIGQEDEFKRMKARYQLFETERGHIIMKLRDDCLDGEPPHFACPHCMNDGKLSYLSPSSYLYGPGWACKRCKTGFAA